MQTTGVSHAHRHPSHSRPRSRRSFLTCRSIMRSPTGKRSRSLPTRLWRRGKGRELPWLVFFQGGPGFPLPRPDRRRLAQARAPGVRVLLLDDATGLSTPMTHQTLTWRRAPEAQAEFRPASTADNIVADAKLIRQRTVGAGWQVEHPRAALRRLLRRALPVGRAGQPPRGDKPAAAAAGSPHGQHLSRNLPPPAGEEPSLFHTLS